MIRYQRLESSLIVHEGQSFTGFLDDKFIFQAPDNKIVELKLKDNRIVDSISIGYLDSMLMEASNHDGVIFMKDSFNNSLYTAKIGKHVESSSCKKIDLDGYSVTNFLIKKRKILCHSIDYKNRTTAIFDLIGDLKWEINREVIGGKNVGDFVVLRVMHNYRNIRLEGRNIDSGDLRWSLDEDNWPLDNFEINELYTYESYILLLSRKVNAVILVNAKTGQLLQTWHNLPNNITYGPHNDNVIPNPTQSVLHKEAGKIIGMAGRYYWEIDLETHALDFQDFTDSFKAMEIAASGKPACQGDYLFFASDALYEQADQPIGHAIKLVAFNWRTRQVEWEHDFGHPGEGFYQVKAPKVHKDYLFTVDSNNTLHIFKKND